MSFIVTLFASCALVVGIIGLFKPELIYLILKKFKRRKSLRYVSIMLRVILGTGLLVMSDSSNSPVFIELLAWVILLSAVADSLTWKQSHLVYVSRLLQYQDVAVRCGSVCFALLGIFLLFALY
ncbi:hypothetical protein [Thalassotalea mangrovi]|uniref:Uncharacterized protein n=1 Tax=Thalassotalea mangrovi TaxID=2572245 RepID=A0A4U1B2G6_9GAMM|nr:hypothetical protein [Thalassotalea mangrovi]TKB42976.1 hypothetical protein E8M12_16205 [Thalassotalea mangrovi]